jgi:flagellar hook-associated protein 3 FlgL
MSSIPSNLTRVSSALSSQIMLSSLTKTNRDLLNMQLQMSSGRRVNVPSDDLIAASGITTLDQMMERRTQLIRNLKHGEMMLNTIDAALGDASSMLLEAKAIGLSHSSTGDPESAAGSAVVIDSLLNEMVSIANRQFQDMYLFGGKAIGNQPMTHLHGGLRYNGIGNGLMTDLGLHRSMPVTVSGKAAFGAMSARVEGKHDLNPAMVAGTRLQDLSGARNLGVNLGTIDITIDDGGGSPVTVAVDLTSAHTVEDVRNAIEQAIQFADPDAVVQIDPDSGTRFQIIPSAGVTVTIADPAAPGTAEDLGVAGVFTDASTLGQDVNPKLTEMTPVSALSTVPPALGMIRLANGDQVRELDLSSAQTIGDIKSLVEGLNIGIRVEINENQDRINFINELSGKHMSISEVGGGTTATQLGVRSFAGATKLSDFNHGLGVQILSGNIDPESGLPDPALDLDFRVTLKDGRTFDVDLAGATTVQDVLDAINAAAGAEGIDVPAEFNAHLAADGNGIALTDSTAGDPDATTSVTALNGSHAASDLGILGETESATLIGEDRAKVAVDSVFSHLIALRDALKANDTAGIALATSKLEADIDRLALLRGEVGARSQRIVDAMHREEDMQLQDMSFKSHLQDLDFTEAALRFSMLQIQLQAGLQTAGMINNLSLLDFLR